MSTFHRNFEFRVSPRAAQRSSRFVTPSTGTAILIGAPVKVDASVAPDALGRQKVILATGEQAPKRGQTGILIYEYKNSEAFVGLDPTVSLYSDLATAPLGQSVQVIHGDKIKVAFINTSALTFLNTRTYAARTMVLGLGSTTSIATGDYLTPGTGNDTSGYWEETSSATNAWLVVTLVDNAAGLVEAEFVY